MTQDDWATEIEMEQREAALRNQITKGAIKPPSDWDGASCTLCGEPIIPPARVALGYHTCLQCQTRLEIVAKRNVT